MWRVKNPGRNWWWLVLLFGAAGFACGDGNGASDGTGGSATGTGEAGSGGGTSTTPNSAAGGSDTSTNGPGGGTTATPTNGDGGAGGETTSATWTGGTPSFADVYEDVLVAGGCTNGYCHGGGTGNLSMLDAETAHAALVDQPASGPKCGESGLVRVVPGDPDESLLWRKVAPGVMTCGSKMPIEQPQLNDVQLGMLHAWISGGAPK